MKSWEHRLEEARPPDAQIPSHRALLKGKLAAGPPQRSLMRSPLVIGILVAVVALAGITAIHPSWASELLRIFLVGERTTTAPDGANVIERTYEVQSQDGSPVVTIIKLEAKDGKVTSEKVDDGLNREFNLLRVEAERQVRSGRAELYTQNAQSRTYKVTLSDGRTIFYTKGPGDSWSISQKE